jgi:hypothetical protein
MGKKRQKGVRRGQKESEGSRKGSEEEKYLNADNG